MCFSIESPKTINFPIILKWKINAFRCPKIVFISIGTPKTIIFPFYLNGKLVLLGVPELKPIRVVVLFAGLRKNGEDISSHQ